MTAIADTMNKGVLTEVNTRPTDKVRNITISFFQSTLFATGTKVGAAFVFTAITIGLSFVATPLIPMVFWVIIVASTVLECVVFRKELLFETTILYTIHRYQGDLSWWNTILDDKLVLGALPLENHLAGLKKEKISSVLSMVEDFELQKGVVHPINPTCWAQEGINWLQVSTPDFRTLTQETIEKGVEFVRAQIDAGKKVYVHCKAGVGRSATIVTAYLLKYGKKSDGTPFDSFDEAYGYVQGRRPQVRLNTRLQRAIKEYAGLA
jgi:atypical dual specificity phosphatase